VQFRQPGVDGRIRTPKKDFYAALDAIGPILEQYPPATMREGDIYRGCRAVAPASGRTRSSGIDDGDGLYLDHEIGSGETGDADGRAGRGRHPEIAHADIGALLELVEVGDKGVGLDDIGPGGAGRLETPVEVLECLFHLRPHIAFADAIAVDVAGQLAGGVDDLAAAAHRHDVRVRRLSTCAVTRRRFPVGARPTRRPLPPEATGAGMEVTKCLKPSDSGHDIR